MSSNTDDFDYIEEMYKIYDDLKKRDRYYALTIDYGTDGEYTDCICKDHKEFVEHIEKGHSFLSEMEGDLNEIITEQNPLHIMYDIHKVTKPEWNKVLREDNQHHRLCNQDEYWQRTMPDHYWVVDYSSMIEITSYDQLIEELEGIKENGITDYPQ